MKRGESDPVWDALVAVFGYTPETRSERAKWNRAAKDLRDAHATPSEIRTRHAAYRAAWPGIACSPLALAAHWGEFAPRSARDWRLEIEAFAQKRRDWGVQSVVDDAVDAFSRRADVDRRFVERIVRESLNHPGGAVSSPSQTPNLEG